MATKRTREDPGRGRRFPSLGNGREDSLSDEVLGRLSRNNGPESQGAYAGEDFGRIEQGAYGDEDFVREEPNEPPDELTRKVLDVESEEKRRDDLAVQDDVIDILTAALPGIRGLRVTVDRGDVTLDGVVADRATEVEAYRLAAKIPGVVDVSGRLRVAQA